MKKGILIDRGIVFVRGKGSMGIPLKSQLVKLMEKPVGVGSEYEIYSVDGEMVIRFPEAKV